MPKSGREQQPRNRIRDNDASTKGRNKTSIDSDTREIGGRVGSDFGQGTWDSHVALLGDSRMSQPANAGQRQTVLRQIQRDYGNQYVQRLVEHVSSAGSQSSQAVAQRAQDEGGQLERAKAPGQQEKLAEKSKGTLQRAEDEELERAKAPGQEEKLAEKSKDMLQRDDTPVAKAEPAGPAYKAGERVAPSFVLEEPAPTRSNSDASTTSRSPAPTFVGHAAIDKDAKQWKYQLDSVESKGKIQIVYYTEDHYPAPTPTDDSGELTNVTEANWKEITTTLETEKTGVATKWSAYQAEDVHEAYHWKDEWQVIMKDHLKKAEDGIAALGVGFDAADNVAAAESELKPKAEEIFNKAMADAYTAWMALGDSAGDPPYLTQPAVIEPLIKRVEDKAKAESWEE